MKVKLVGFEEVGYTSKKTGRDVRGTRVHLEVEMPMSVSGRGVRTQQEFVSESVASSVLLEVGCEYELFYNRYGRVEEIRIA